MFDWLFKRLETKASVGQEIFTQQYDCPSQDLEAYANEGYGQNPTTYACISLIADAFGSVPLYVKKGDDIVEDHPLQEVLDRPNPDEGGVEFRTAAASWILLTGNSFTEKIKEGSTTQLWNWKPYEMNIMRKKGDRMPSAYVFGKNQAYQKTWEVNPINGESDMMHWRRFNPAKQNSWMGQAPLKAGAASVDQNNAADRWRYSTFKNNGAPSGVLSTEQEIGATTRKELQRDLQENTQGERNARNIMLLGGGLKWTQVAMSPQDMDWLEGTKMLDQKIASVFRVPTQLLGIEGSQTYANYAEARLAFYTQAVLPLLDLYISELNRWLGVDFEGHTICYNKEDIDALEPLRTEKRAELLGTNVLTINEKRKILGYEKVGDQEAETIFIQPSDIPLGTDILDEDEQDINNAAKALMKLEGIPYQVAYQKAFDIYNDRKTSDEIEL